MLKVDDTHFRKGEEHAGESAVGERMLVFGASTKCQHAAGSHPCRRLSQLEGRVGGAKQLRKLSHCRERRQKSSGENSWCSSRYDRRGVKR